MHQIAQYFMLKYWEIAYYFIEQKFFEVKLGRN